MKKTLKCGKCGDICECDMCNFYSESDCGCKGECIRPDDKGCDCDNCGNQLRKPKNEQKKRIENYTPIFEKYLSGNKIFYRVMLSDGSWRDLADVNYNNTDLDIFEKSLIMAFNLGFLSYKILIAETQVMFPNFLLSRSQFKWVKR